MARRRQANQGTSGSSPGRLRIVAGKWRSRFLPVVDIPGLRPTSERVRETLFNWLARDVVGAHCLDLFAGTGVLGFEALSRGARRVQFVELSKKAADTIVANIGALDASGAALENCDAFEFLAANDDELFDIVFLDPPFADESLDELCRLLQSSGRLADGALVYLEQDKGHAPPVLPDGWTVLRDKTAGKVRYFLVQAGGNG